MSVDKKLDLIEFLRADHTYPSGYRYPREEVERVFGPDSTFMQRVKAGAVRGQLGMPVQRPGEPYNQYSTRIGQIDESEVCHRIASLQLNEDGTVTGTVKLDGPKSDQMEKLLSDSARPRFAMRAFMQVERKDGVITPVPGTMEVVTYDYMPPAREHQKRGHAHKQMQQYNVYAEKRKLVNGTGRPGDIVISGVNIHQMRREGKDVVLPLQRQHTVFISCRDGSWLPVGFLGEWFGNPPGREDDSILSYTLENPSGTIYEEYMGKSPFICTHRKYFGQHDGNAGLVNYVDYLIDYYATQETPRRNSYRRRGRSAMFKKPSIDKA